MNESNYALSQRGSYAVTGFDKFLWWLSTAEPEIIADCAIDRNRFKIIGMSVLATWAFASFAWTYFFSTITPSIFLAVLLGLFMGFIILTIDRALIKGITRTNKRKWLPLAFRGLLALTIGTFMAQPVILYMFDKEIRLQTSLDNEKKKITKRAALDSLYRGQKNELLQTKTSIKNELDSKYAAVSTARQNFLSETDGSGGSGKVGIKAIAMAKKLEYEKLDEDYRSLLKQRQPQLDSIERTLTSQEQTIKQAESNFNGYLNDGFLTRVEALSNILGSSIALRWRYYLVVFILMLIELMPVIAKTMLPSGTYDEKIQLREEMEKELAATNIRREKALKEKYNEAAFEQDSNAIDEFFTATQSTRSEKINAFSKAWKDSDQTMDGYWEKMKKEIITKQEN